MLYKLNKVVWSGTENTAAENNAYFQFFGNHKFLKRQNKNCKTIYSDIFLRITELSSTSLCFKKEKFRKCYFKHLKFATKLAKPHY